MAQCLQDAEQKLWRHVILNALEDVYVDLNDRKSAVKKNLKRIIGLLKHKRFRKDSAMCGVDRMVILTLVYIAIVKDEIYKKHSKSAKNIKQVKWQK